MNKELETIIKEIDSRYEERLASKYIAQIIEEISKGGTYKDVYKFVRGLGLGEIFTSVLNENNFIINNDEYVETAREFITILEKYANKINDLTELVQLGINKSMGVRIKPQNVTPSQNWISAAVDSIINGNNYYFDDEEKLIANWIDLNADITDFGTELTDKIIQKNAEIHAKSGFGWLLIRRYDDVGIHDYSRYSQKRKKIHPAEVCKFCKGLEGVYNYLSIDSYSDLWKRHKGCTCSIDIVGGSTERVQNYIKRK